MPKRLGRVGEAEVEVEADLEATTNRTEALLVVSSCG